jgi:hypothetical protein
MKPRELTKDEVTDKFLKHIKAMEKYWEGLPNKSSEEKLNGLAFSILVLLDGGAGFMPSFIVAPSPHEEDKDFCINEEKTNYFPENHQIEDKIKCDISGGLHELYAKLK